MNDFQISTPRTLLSIPVAINVHKNSNVSSIKVVTFNDDWEFQISEEPQEVWPFLETGRT